MNRRTAPNSVDVMPGQWLVSEHFFRYFCGVIAWEYNLQMNDTTNYSLCACQTCFSRTIHFVPPDRLRPYWEGQEVSLRVGWYDEYAAYRNTPKIDLVLLPSAPLSFASHQMIFRVISGLEKPIIRYSYSICMHEATWRVSNTLEVEGWLELILCNKS